MLPVIAPSRFTAWKRTSGFGVVLMASLLALSGRGASSPRAKPEPVALVVMDPLAKELACACLKGYAQRDYRKLAARLEKAIKQRVAIEFSDDLAETVAGFTSNREVIVVGDQSLVAAGARQARLKCQAICELTGLDGGTRMEGLFVARSDDSPRELKDLGGRTLLMGIAVADEKQTAARDTLRRAGVDPGVKLEQRASASEAALEMLDSRLSPPPVVAIPAYSLPLLEGCGSVQPGRLRVIGRTRPMPFIAVFASEAIPAAKRELILRTLLEVKHDATLLKAIESRDGFQAVDAPEPGGKKAGGSAWWDWRGAERDGHVPRLPTRLPATVNLVWKKAAMSGGLAGLSVNQGRLILAERDFAEEHDLYRCLSAETGETLWHAMFPARGKLDYGQSPRAAPVIHDGKAFLLGALGGLRCVNLADGKLIWERQLQREFKAKLPTWGMCCPPLLVEDLLIVNPGAPKASLAALDCATGRTRWTTPGLPAAYSAFICASYSGGREIVGYDQRSLGGWDLKTGARLWQVTPVSEGDFNVPTPVAVEGGILVSTENNGTRFYRFDAAGRIDSQPSAAFADLSPTTTSPVVTCGRVFGTHQGLYCLDLRKGLSPVWHCEEEASGDHASLIADDERVLVITLAGEMILLDARADRCTVISRLRLFQDDVEVYAHPALVGTRLFARAGTSVMCVDLGSE